MSGSIEGKRELKEPNAPGGENIMIPQVAALLTLPSLDLVYCPHNSIVYL